MTKLLEPHVKRVVFGKASIQEEEARLCQDIGQDYVLAFRGCVENVARQRLDDPLSSMADIAQLSTILEAAMSPVPNLSAATSGAFSTAIISQARMALG